MNYASGCLIWDKDGYILAFQREDGAIGFPCGNVESWRYESPADAAVRETFEETGYVVELHGYYYQGIDVEEDYTVFIWPAKILDRKEPTTPGEGSALWVKPTRLLTGKFQYFNRELLKYYRMV